MMSERGRGALVGRSLRVLAALCVSAAVLALFAFGYGPVPALGRALVPGHGAWASAAGGQPVRSQTLALPGLSHPVSVAFTSHGVASIRAASDGDAFLALGYLHARFRLTEMDLERRLGEGKIAQLAGPAGLSSDKFELRLGLLRTAQAEWAATPPASPAGEALLAYSRGVNDYLAQVRRTGDWPSIYALAGVYPVPWTPVDSMVLQGVLTQQLDYTTTPLDYALLERSLGAARTMAWFPVLAPGQHTAYDPGPYKYRGIAPIAPQATADLLAQGPVPGPSRASRAEGPVPGPAARVALPAAPPSPRVSGATPVTAADVRQRAEAPAAGPAHAGVSARTRPPRQRCWRRRTSCRSARSTSTPTATPGRPTGPCWQGRSRCWPVTRTCPRPCPRSGTRRPCPRPACP